MKNKLLSILLHPLFIALAISLVIIYFLPEYFTKYKVELVEQDNVGEIQKVYFEDLNGDHKSERIVAQETLARDASFIIYSDNGSIIDQWNFEKKYANKSKNIQFFDLDKNGYKEVYLITQKKDSVFLNSIEPLNKQNNNPTEIFIDTIGEYNNKYMIASAILMFNKSNSANKNILYLNINCGFAGYPRNAYKINIKTKSVDRSPHLTNHSHISHLVDLNEDGSKEIIIRNGSSNNTIDSSITARSDGSSWLMILDSNLNFLFEPIEFKIPYSSISAIPIKNKKGDSEIITIVRSKQRNISQNILYLFSKSGKVIKQKILPYGTYDLFTESDENTFFLHNKNNGFIQYYNFDFEELTSVFIEPKSNIYPLDIDKKGKTEWFVKSQDQNKITIYQNDFKDPIEFQIQQINDNLVRHGLKQIGKRKYEIYFQKGIYYYVYNYDENPLYIFRYLIYFGIFLIVLGLVWLVRKGQQIQTKKQRAIEKEIAELQIKTLKNQVDPHFVFNAINTISEMTLTEDKIEADKFICRFSDFMRETLKQSDQISYTLKEELDFVENFIQLQQVRYFYGFDYQIEIDKDVPLETKVPKHVLFSYVENAIKHGLSNKKEKGLLKIKAHKEDKSLLLSVEDNGSGMNSLDKPKKGSTGNGLKIMEQMFQLYTKLYKKKIQYQMIELFDQENNKIGIKIEIRIAL